jgi:hypothetical protein
MRKHSIPIFRSSIHHHIWAWLNYGLDEFLADICAGHNIQATVHLDPGFARNESDPEHQLHLEAEPPSSETIAAVYCPFFDPCVEAFGAERCMFESNYPADRQQVDYVILWSGFKRLAVGATAEEKRALFSDTARQTYSLPDR